MLSALSPVASWCQIELSAVFGHNMVLQKDQENPIWGRGPANQKIWVEYKGLQWNGKIASDGTWRGALNLKKWRVEPGPGSLYVGLGKPSQQPLLELTNLVVGRVWLFAGWDKKGIPATSGEDQHPPPDRLRFITVRDIMGLKTSVSSEIPSWDNYPAQPGQFERFPKLSLLVGNALLGKDYVGIIQTTAGSLAPAFLGRGSRSPHNP